MSLSTSLFLKDLATAGFGVEILYFFVIAFCSLAIYFGTKELYELSSYKGIKYFRQAFLFFALAYFLRIFIRFIIIYFGVGEIVEFSPTTFRVAGLLTLFLFMYLSSMAIFYLLYSVMWKRWNGNSYKNYLLHACGLAIALISILSREFFVYLGLNIFLLLVTFFVVYTSYKYMKNKSKGHNLHFIYALLSTFWIFNVLDILVPAFFQAFRLVIYLISSGIFLLILYRVIKRVGSN